MANYRQEGRRGGNDRNGRFVGRERDRDGGRNRGRDRDFSERRRPLDMHDVICDKCGKECQVPFKPSSDKPVYCSDCFRKNEGSGGSRNQDKSSGMSPEQFNQINEKLDKILEVLQSLEVETGDDDSEEDSE